MEIMYKKAPQMHVALITAVATLAFSEATSAINREAIKQFDRARHITIRQFEFN